MQLPAPSEDLSEVCDLQALAEYKGFELAAALPGRRGSIKKNSSTKILPSEAVTAKPSPSMLRHTHPGLYQIGITLRITDKRKLK